MIGKIMDNKIFNQAPISAKTTPPSSSPVVYAGFMRRFVAYGIDAFFTSILGGILGFITGNDVIVSISAGTIVAIIYTAIFDSSELRGTPGKAILGMAVVTETDQDRISFQTAIVRYLCKYISSFVLLIGYLIQPFTDKRQTFHDMASNTIVIKKDPGQLSYWKSFKDNFNKILNN
jgi:uncharacterized RDD family membrane protein YckC